MKNGKKRWIIKFRAVLVMILAATALIAVTVEGKEVRAAENMKQLVLNGRAVVVGNEEYFCFTPDKDGAYEVSIRRLMPCETETWRIYSYNQYRREEDPGARDGGVELGNNGGPGDEFEYDSETGMYCYDKAIPYYLEAGNTYCFEFIYMDDGGTADVSIRTSERAGIDNGFLWHMCDDYVAETDYAVIYDYKDDGRANVTVPGTVGDNNGIPVKKINDATLDVYGKENGTSITNIRVEENIEQIGDNNCLNLESVELPSSLKDLMSFPFHSTEHKLRSITFPNGSQYFLIQADALLGRGCQGNDEQYRFIYYFGRESEQYMVPEGTGWLEQGCFDEKIESPFQKLVFPESLVYIKCMIYADEVYFNNGCVSDISPSGINSSTTVYGESHSLLETWCRKNQIAFVPTGEQQKEFVLKEGEAVEVETYGDGTAYCSFNPPETSEYRLTGIWGGSSLVLLNSSGSVIQPSSEISERGEWTYRFEKGQTYSIQVSNKWNVKHTITIERFDSDDIPAPTNSSLPQTSATPTNPIPEAGTAVSPSPSDADIPAHEKSVAKPAKGKISSAKNEKRRKIKVQIKRIARAVGYQIQYAKNKNFSESSTRNTKKISYVIKNLKNKKTYYIRVRAYVMDGSQKVYGSWSKAKKVKVKK